MISSNMIQERIEEIENDNIFLINHMRKNIYATDITAMEYELKVIEDYIDNLKNLHSYKQLLTILQERKMKYE